MVHLFKATIKFKQRYICQRCNHVSSGDQETIEFYGGKEELEERLRRHPLRASNMPVGWANGDLGFVCIKCK